MHFVATDAGRLQRTLPEEWDRTGNFKTCLIRSYVNLLLKQMMSNFDYKRYKLRGERTDTSNGNFLSLLDEQPEGDVERRITNEQNKETVIL